MVLTLQDLGLTADSLVALAPGPFTVLDGEGRFAYANPSAARLLGRSPEHLLRTSFLDVFEPRERERLQRLFGSSGSGELLPFRVRSSSGELLVLAQTFELSAPYKAFILIDVTDSLRAQRAAAAQSQISARLTYGGDLEASLNAVSKNVCDATGCLGCSVVLFEAEPPRVTVAGNYNLAATHNQFFEAACSRGLPLVAVDVYLSGLAKVRSGARATVMDLARRMGPEYEAMVASLPWDTIVSLPLRHNDVVTGTLNCFYEGTAVPGCGEMNFLQSIADQAAVAVQNARLFADAEGKAILEERQRLARELHDSVSQALYGIGLGARTALDRLAADASAREAVEYVLSLAETGMAEMRALIFELRPEALEQDGLVVTLQRLLTALAARHGLQVVSPQGTEPPLSAASRETLYRVAREAMSNSVKHAAASRLEVKLEASDGAAVLTVQDDGSGFDATRRFPGHLGLTSMRERVDKAGGQFELRSAPGQGTRLRVRVPLLDGEPPR